MSRKQWKVLVCHTFGAPVTLAFFSEDFPWARKFLRDCVRSTEILIERFS